MTLESQALKMDKTAVVLVAKKKKKKVQLFVGYKTPLQTESAVVGNFSSELNLGLILHFQNLEVLQVKVEMHVQKSFTCKYS